MGSHPSINMKFLVLTACVAISNAALVTFPNGAVEPADTPAVAAARAAHLGQLGHVLPYAHHPYAAGYPHGLVAHANGAVVPADTPDVYAAKVAHAAAGLVVHPNGAVVPLEPADVVKARADHLAAVAAA